MTTGLAVMTGISMIWFFISASYSGWFGIRLMRYVKHGFKDKDESERLLRVLTRYENGEFTVQMSKYNDNLLFTKVVTNTSSGVSYDSQRIYVQVDDPDHFCFGWLSDEPTHIVHYKQNFRLIQNNRSPITTEAWLKLMELLNLLKEDSEKPAKHGFFKRKRTTEEVHLS